MKALISAFALLAFLAATTLPAVSPARAQAQGDTTQTTTPKKTKTTKTTKTKKSTSKTAKKTKKKKTTTPSG